MTVTVQTSSPGQLPRSSRLSAARTAAGGADSSDGSSPHPAHTSSSLQGNMVEGKGGELLRSDWLYLSYVWIWNQRDFTEYERICQVVAESPHTQNRHNIGHMPLYPPECNCVVRKQNVTSDIHTIYIYCIHYTVCVCTRVSTCVSIYTYTHTHTF